MQKLKTSWRELKEDEPGHRFRNRYEHARGAASTARILKIVLGVALIAIGAVLLVIPGPGSVLIVIGVACLADISGNVARALDSTELWVRTTLQGFRSRLRPRRISRR